MNKILATDTAFQAALDVIEAFDLADHRYSIDVSPVRPDEKAVNVLFHDVTIEEVGKGMAWSAWGNTFGRAVFIEPDGTQVTIIAQQAPKPKPKCCGNCDLGCVA